MVKRVDSRAGALPIRVAGAGFAQEGLALDSASSDDDDHGGNCLRAVDSPEIMWSSTK